MALLRAAPRDVRLVGLTDPSLPPLIDEARDHVAETHPNAYAAIRALDDPDERTPFVSLSPMTHDPLFAARFLSGATRLRVAVVYDFIRSDGRSATSRIRPPASPTRTRCGGWRAATCSPRSPSARATT